MKFDKANHARTSFNVLSQSGIRLPHSKTLARCSDPGDFPQGFGVRQSHAAFACCLPELKL
jgi:hypothetical protein